FTVGQGILNEVYFPRIDQAQIGDHQLLFSHVPGIKFLEEKKDFKHAVEHPRGVPRPVIRSRFGEGNRKIEFIKEIVTDPVRPVLRIKYRFIALPEEAKVYVLHKPTADNDGDHDHGRATNHEQFGRIFLAWDEETEHVAQALIVTAKTLRSSVGIVGESDGWQDLAKHGRLVNSAEAKGPANLAYTAELDVKREFEVAIGFGPSPERAAQAAAASLKVNFNELRRTYDSGWRSYLKRLGKAPWLERLPSKLREDLLWNAAVIKAHEDKTYPGAIIASLSIPDLPAGRGHQDGKNTGGYHLVWPRDLFKSAIALLRLGDVRSALQILAFMSIMEHDGRMAQNTWVNGRPFWTGEQMDQEAFPILLAHELTRAGVEIPDHLQAFIKRRIERVRSSSGRTGQERWEEASGFSPNTLAVMAAAMSRIGDNESAKRFLKVALEKTVSRKGPLSSEPYFIRIAQNGEPDAGHHLQIANGGPSLQEYRILDGGFLEWVRWFPNPEKYFGELGAELSAIIENTTRIYDATESKSSVRIEGAPLYHRYTADAYGIDRRGGPWPILTLERALPELKSEPRNAFKLLRVVRELWGQGDLCPEQLRGPKPMPHAANPLVWCHAEMIELSYKLSKAQKDD
ncbi:MAG: glycoside hydrolase family 15 protein, partial [Bdellovibrionota bacterium]